MYTRSLLDREEMVPSSTVLSPRRVELLCIFSSGKKTTDVVYCWHNCTIVTFTFLTCSTCSYPRSCSYAN